MLRNQAQGIGSKLFPIVAIIRFFSFFYCLWIEVEKNRGCILSPYKLKWNVLLTWNEKYFLLEIKCTFKWNVYFFLAQKCLSNHSSIFSSPTDQMFDVITNKKRKTVKFRFLCCHIVTLSRGIQIEIPLQIAFRDVMVMKHRVGPHSGSLSGRAATMQGWPSSSLRLVCRTPVCRHDHVVPLVEGRRGEPDPVRVWDETGVRSAGRSSSEKYILGEWIWRRRVGRGPVRRWSTLCRPRRSGARHVRIVCISEWWSHWGPGG